MSETPPNDDSLTEAFASWVQAWLRQSMLPGTARSVSSSNKRSKPV
jgi:hypothetical protein